MATRFHSVRDAVWDTVPERVATDAACRKRESDQLLSSPQAGQTSVTP